MASSPTLLAGQDMTADLVGAPAWIAMSPLLNTWANFGGGFVTAQYRLWKLSNKVEVVGTISGGTTTNGTNIFTLPAGFIPATNSNHLVQNNTAGAYIEVTSAGQLQINNIAAASIIAFQFEFSLDA